MGAGRGALRLLAAAVRPANDVGPFTVANTDKKQVKPSSAQVAT